MANRQDKKDAAQAHPRQREVGTGQLIPEQERLEKHGKYGKTGVREKPDGDRRDLDGLEKRRPVGSQNRSQDGKQAGAFLEDPAKAETGRRDDDSQGQAGEGHPSEDNQWRGEGKPFAEQPGQAEQRHRRMNFDQAAFELHDSSLPERHYITGNVLKLRAFVLK